MTESEFKKAFAGIGWKAVYENGENYARVLLKSGRTEIVAGTTWPDDDTRDEDLREMTFHNAALDLGGRPRPDSGSWSFAVWYIDGEAVKSPGWYMDLNTREPRVGSAEEFVFKMSTLGS